MHIGENMENKKKINWTRVVLLFWTLVGVIGTIVTVPLYLKTKDKVVYGFMMVFITLAYEFVMRIILGIVLIIPKYNVERRYFKASKLEMKIYNGLKMKKWVTHAPTFNPDQYDATKLTLDEIILNTVRNEVTHSVYFFLTFVPIIWSIWLGYLPFNITQALIVIWTDILLIAIQRFNRQRLVKLNRRTKRG